jgi:hypothetical protein
MHVRARYPYLCLASFLKASDFLFQLILILKPVFGKRGAGQGAEDLNIL